MALKATLYKDPGDIVVHAAGTDLAAGDIVTLAGVAGMVVDDIDVSTNGTGSLRIRGAISVRKAGTAISAGDSVGWDVDGTAYSGLTGGCADNVESKKNFHLGVALVNAAATDASVIVDINSSPAMTKLASICNAATGTDNGTITDSGHGGTSATAIDDNFVTINNKVNNILTILKQTGLMKYA